MTKIRCQACGEDKQITVYYTAPLKCVCRTCKAEWQHVDRSCPKCKREDLRELETDPVHLVCDDCNIEFSTCGITVLHGLSAIRVRPSFYLGFTADHVRGAIDHRFVPDDIPGEAQVQVDEHGKAVWLIGDTTRPL